MSLENILLGMLDEPASGYDLGGEFEASARMFWFAELSQIYPALRRLEARGFLRSSEAASTRGPKRRVYTRTPQGDAALREWLRSEPEVKSVRLPYVAQLYFLGHLGEAPVSHRFFESLRRELTAQLERFESIGTYFEDDCSGPDETSDVEFHHYAALRAGLHVVRARLAWCDEMIAALDRRSPGASPEPEASGTKKVRPRMTAERGA